jgi:hypothetical protein
MNAEFGDTAGAPAVELTQHVKAVALCPRDLSAREFEHNDEHALG